MSALLKCPIVYTCIYISNGCQVLESADLCTKSKAKIEYPKNESPVMYSSNPWSIISSCTGFL